MADDGVVKMEVSDSNGEVSASVEETNRVREKLGLPPLKEESGGGGTSREHLQTEPLTSLLHRLAMRQRRRALSERGAACRRRKQIMGEVSLRKPGLSWTLLTVARNKLTWNWLKHVDLSTT